MSDEIANKPEIRFKGYTETWELRKLKDFSDTSDRYSFTGGPFGSDLKSSDYTKKGVRIIQLQNIGDGLFFNDYKIYTSNEKADSLSSNLIYPNEIIIAKMAEPLARATIIPQIEERYLMASDGIRLKIDTKKYDNYFIVSLINHPKFRKLALENSTGTTRKRIGLVTLGALLTQTPNFEEQTKIGNFFKQLDDTIALHQRELDLLKQTKQTYLQKMFPKSGENEPEIRFAGFTDAWELRRVGNFLSESKIKGSNGETAKKLPVKLWRKGIIPKRDVYQGSSSTQYYIRYAGQFMYGKLDFLNQAFGILPNELDSYESTLDSPAFDFENGIDPNFFLEYVCLDKFYKYQGNMANGSRKAKRIHTDTFLEMPFVSPEIEEQQKIGDFFKQLDDTITLHQRELDSLKEIKKILLHKMFA